MSKENTKECTDVKNKCLQQIVRIIIYYAEAVNIIILIVLSTNVTNSKGPQKAQWFHLNNY